MVKIILAVLALAVCAEATFDVLLMNLLKHKAPRPHYPPPPPPPPRQVYYRPVPPRMVPVQPVQPVQVRYVYVQQPVAASYYRHPVSTLVDVPRFPTVSYDHHFHHQVDNRVDVPQLPTVSQATATASAVSDSVVIQGKQEPLSFTPVATKEAPVQPAVPVQQSQTLSLPFAQSGPSFNVETAKSESHSFALQPEPINLDQSQASDTIEVQPEDDEEEDNE